MAVIRPPLIYRGGHSTPIQSGSAAPLSVALYHPIYADVRNSTDDALLSSHHISTFIPQAESGAKVEIPKEPEPGSNVRKITLMGSAEQVAKCEELIRYQTDPAGIQPHALHSLARTLMGGTAALPVGSTAATPHLMLTTALAILI